jgi:hypothetical protein
MARLLTLDAVTVGLRNALLACMRSEDEGLLLPQSSQSVESGVFKNVVFRLAGDSSSVNPAVFSHDLFAGLSILQISDVHHDKIRALLQNQSAVQAKLKALADAIPSEICDPALQVGPPLDCDELERDAVALDEAGNPVPKDEFWTCGFDSASCFVGLFSAQNSKAPEVGVRGMNRVFDQFFLVCKAGGGIAATTFHSRLTAALARPGATLDSVLGEGGTLGAVALRRVSVAAQRNRQRILHMAAEVLGINVSNVGDQAARNRHRLAVADVEIVTNSIRRLDDTARPTFQVTNAVDCTLSRGCAVLSNATDGLLLYLDANGDKRIHIKQNEAWSSVPFSTERLIGERDVVANLKRSGAVGAHSDAAWIRDRFAWKNRAFSEGQPDVLPFCFHGSHDTESFAKSFNRELGLSTLGAVRLRPALVAVAGVTGGKLRALVQK